MTYEPSSIIKAELRRRSMTYKELARALDAVGEGEHPATIANVVSRGKMSAARFLKYLSAMGCRRVQIADEPR